MHQENLFPAAESAPVPSWMRAPEAAPELKPLRPLQARTVAALKASLAQRPAARAKRTMVKSPTGSGKTVIASHIIQSALSKGRRVWFIVNAISLIDQTVTKFWQEGIRLIGVMQGDHEMTDVRQPVQVCSVQTLSRRSLLHIAKPDLILVDEAHNWFQFYEQLFAMFPEVPIVGLSATPYTKGLGRHYDDLVIACTTQELIDQGLLSPFVVYGPKVRADLSQVRKLADDYNEADLAKAMNQPKLIADVVECWLQLAQGRPTLCFAVDCAHAKALQEKFQAAGVPAGYMDANTEIDERREIGEAFARGELKVVTNVGVLTTGIDWDVRCIILDRPTKSEILFQQIIGRGLRTATGKDYCLILDHSNTHEELGYVTDVDDRNTELDGGVRKPGQLKLTNPRLPFQCPSCRQLRPAHAHKCPGCGFTPVKQVRQNTVENLEGELAKFEGKKERFTPEQKRAFLAEVTWIAQTKGYKPGWAANKYRERFKVWPKGFGGVAPAEPTPETLSWIKASQIRWAKRKTP